MKKNSKKATAELVKVFRDFREALEERGGHIDSMFSTRMPVEEVVAMSLGVFKESIAVKQDQVDKDKFNVTMPDCRMDITGNASV